MRKRWLGLLLLLPACGCVGYQTYLPEEKSVEDLELAKGVELPVSELTPETLLQYKGEPSEKQLEGDGETWVYLGERQWAGVLLIAVVVPVPLVLPVARDRLEVRFEGQRAVSARVRAVEDHWRSCGMLPGPCGVGPLGCDSR